MGKWFDFMKSNDARKAGFRIAPKIGRDRTPGWHKEGDGIIVLSDAPPQPSIGLRGFACLVAAFLVFKASVIVWLGPETFQAALGELEGGALFDRLAALIMAPDLVSQALAGQIIVFLG